MISWFSSAWRTALAALLLPFAISAADLPSAPTAQRPGTNSSSGLAVRDDYQWLEEAAVPEVRDWTRLQNSRTRGYYDGLPFRDGIAQQLRQLRTEESARYGALTEKKGRIFALRSKPPAQQPVLVRLSLLDPPALWRPVFDPNKYNTNGTTAIDWYVPSPDGRLVAISLSEGGSEQGTLHFFEVDTGKELSDVIPRVQYPTGGGSAAWTADGTGILYTRYPHQGERPEADVNFYQQVWFHRLGAPVSDDKLEIGADFPRIAEVELETSENGQWIVASLANGDGGDFAHYVRNSSGQWQQISHFEDGVKAAKIGRDNSLYLLSRKDAPHGKILRLPLEVIGQATETAAPLLSAAKLVAPEREGVVQEFAPADHGIYNNDLMGGPSALAYFPQQIDKPVEIPILPVS